MNTVAIVLDLDGVIVKTNFVKHDAMLSLFADHPAEKRSISAFILANGGVPRREKLARLLQDHLHMTPTEQLLEDYLRRYASELEHRLAEAPMVKGVEDFIANVPCARYVCSSAPEDEVHGQLARRSLAPYFAAVYGGGTSKVQALRNIAATHPGQSVVFFGDAVGDHDAARQAAVAFVGVVCERDNFAGLQVVKLKDFGCRTTVEQAMLRALAGGLATVRRGML